MIEAAQRIVEKLHIKLDFGKKVIGEADVPNSFIQLGNTTEEKRLNS